MNLTKKIGKTVRNYRKAKGLSQEKLAELSGLSTSYISLIESGQKEISLSKLEIISEILDFKMLFLAKQNDSNKNKFERMFRELPADEQLFFMNL